MNQEKGGDVEILHQRIAGNDDQKADTVISNQIEAHLTLKDAFRYYKKAILWSLVISNATIMESYDLILLKSFYAYPAFNKAYGEYLPDGSWAIPSRWQIGLSMSTNVGLIIGGMINGWISDKYSPRRVMVYCHLFVTGFIFIPFFAKRVEALLAGMLLLSVNILGPHYHLANRVSYQLHPVWVLHHIRVHLCC
jgi:SP family general alpha glucoside:H+ symporter-like MFS transporter